MTVLKDAASAALYGSRGANGVIIITTKQGQQDSKATVKVKATLGGSSRAVRDYDRVNTNQYFELYWKRFATSMPRALIIPLPPQLRRLLKTWLQN